MNTNINKALVITISIIGIVLVVLTVVLYIRRLEVVKNNGTSENTSTADTKTKNSNALNNSEEMRLEKEAQQNPLAAVEGIRSPTPLPPNTLTITDTQVEPQYLQIIGAELTVINRTNKNMEVTYSKNGSVANNAPKVIVESGTTQKLNIPLNKTDRTRALFKEQGTGGIQDVETHPLQAEIVSY